MIDSMLTRSRWLSALLVSGVALAAGTALGQPSAAIGDRPDCVTAVGRVVNTGFGFNHSVHVSNGCSFAVDCHVSTDVNPHVNDIHLAPGASTDVATFLGSPASTFVPNVVCPYEHRREPTISDPGE